MENNKDLQDNIEELQNDVKEEFDKLDKELLTLYRLNHKLNSDLEKANTIIQRQQLILHKFKEEEVSKSSDLETILQNIKEFTDNNNDLESFDVSTTTHNVLSEFVKLFGFELGTNIDYLNLNNIFNTISDFTIYVEGKNAIGDISTIQFNILSDFAKLLGYSLIVDEGGGNCEKK